MTKRKKWLIEKTGGRWKGRAFIYAKGGENYVLHLPFGISIFFSIVKRVSNKEIDLEMEAQKIYLRKFLF